MPGTMVAIWLPQDVAETLAASGGEAASELHITLGYLGKDVPAATIKRVRQAVRELATDTLAFEITLRGTASFPPSESSDQKTPHYARVQSPELLRLRKRLVGALADIGVELDGTHPDYTPHVTLAYTDPEASFSATVPETRFPCTELVLAIGEKRTAFPLQRLAKSKRLSFIRKQVPLVAPRLRRRGSVDWDALPPGSAVKLKVNDPASRLHGQSYLVQGNARRQKLVAPLVGQKDRPLHPLADPDPATAAGPRADPAQLRQALDALYGSDAPLPLGEWRQVATEYARDCGYEPDAAARFGSVVAAVLGEVTEARRTQLRHRQREAATESLRRRHNNQLKPDKQVKREQKLAESQPYYSTDHGIHLADGPVSADDLARALAAPSAESSNEGTPLRFSLSRGIVRSLREVPLSVLEHRVQVLLQAQARTHADRRGQHTPKVPSGAFVIDTPAFRAEPFTDPKRAEAALPLHATHDALVLKAAGGAPHVPTVRTDDPRLAAILHPATCASTLAQATLAGSAVWADTTLLREQLPHLCGFAATSHGAAALCAEALNGVATSEIERLAAVLSPEALALLVVGLAYRKDGLDCLEELLPLARSLLSQVQGAAAPAEQPEAQSRADEARTLAAEAGRAAEALGRSQFARALYWAVSELPALAFKHTGVLSLPVELRFPEAADAAAATRAALLRGSVSVPIDLLHDGDQTVLRLPLAGLVQFAEYHFEASHWLAEQRQLKYDQGGVAATDDGALFVPEAGLTLAERNAVNWLAHGPGGVVQLGLDRDWTAIVAAYQNRATLPSVLVVVPDHDCARATAALSQQVLPEHGPVASFSGQDEVAKVLTSPVVVVPESQVLSLYDIVSALHPDLLVIVDPSGFGQQDGVIDPTLAALFSIHALERLAFVPHGISEAPLRLYDLVAWTRRGVRENFVGSQGHISYADLLPPPEVISGWEVGVGCQSAAARGAAAGIIGQALAPFVFGGPLPQLIESLYQEELLPQPALAVLDRLKDLAKPGKAQNVLSLADKAQQKRDTAARLRPLFDHVLGYALDQEQSPRLRALAARLTSQRKRAIVVCHHLQFVNTLACLRSAGFDFEPGGNAVALGWGMEGALTRWRQGAAELLLLDATLAAYVDLVSAETLHVIGAPATAARLLRPDGSGEGENGVVVWGYRYDSPADAGRWELLAAACARAGDTRLQKARYQSGSYRGEATEIPLDPRSDRTLRRWDTSGQPTFANAEQPSLWPSFFRQGQYAHWQPVEDLLRQPLAEAHSATTNTRARFHKQLGEPFSAEEALLEPEKELPFAHYDGKPVHIGRHNFFRADRFGNLQSRLEHGDPVFLPERDTPEDRDAPGALDWNYAGAHLRGVKGLFADPDVVWAKHNPDGSERRFYLKRYAISAAGPGRGGPLALPARLSDPGRTDLRYHYAIGDFAPQEDGWHLQGKLDYTRSGHARDLKQLLAAHAETVKPLRTVHVAARRLLEEQPLRRSFGHRHTPDDPLLLAGRR